jgi:hypothetical protein|tara:strand:- start:593 stop:1171 length:579 start_codon:yes stop_codon:yes gene_type:complete
MKPLKIATIGLGALIGVAHIGVLGHLIRQTPERVIQVPTINIPSGTPYSSYKIEAGKHGYKIEYKANDPAILESQRSLDLTKSKSGFFGGNNYEDRNEYRTDQYTMEGVRNMGGASLPGEGKSAKNVECIVADAGARSQGAMAGTAISTGLIAPAVMNIPYVGWLVAGWANLLGQRAGEEAGSRVGSVFNDC